MSMMKKLVAEFIGTAWLWFLVAVEAPFLQRPL